MGKLWCSLFQCMVTSVTMGLCRSDRGNTTYTLPWCSRILPQGNQIHLQSMDSRHELASTCKLGQDVSFPWVSWLQMSVHSFFSNYIRQLIFQPSPYNPEVSLPSAPSALRPSTVITPTLLSFVPGFCYSRICDHFCFQGAQLCMSIAYYQSWQMTISKLFSDADGPHGKPSLQPW